MRTLVYFASGHFNDLYQELDYEKIYLIDNCFNDKRKYSNRIFSKGKITCLGMDCLESIEYLKKEKVKIDCFVSLNEGLYEGGGSYAINSDMFLGYAMPLFKDQYIHIMNKNYYNNMFHVTMDLPYSVVEINEDDNRYLSPFIFSKDNYHKGHANVFQMTKLIPNCIEVSLNQSIKLNIIHDSIWHFYDELDLIIISFANQGQSDFFDNIPKVTKINHQNFDDLFSYIFHNKINTIGFTPWGKGNYFSFIEKLKNWNDAYPKEINLFHLNKNDFKEIKDSVSYSD